MYDTPTSGHDPALPRDKRRMQDIRSDALTLAGVLHILDHFDPTDRKGEAAAYSLKGVAAQLAEKLADDLEEWI